MTAAYVLRIQVGVVCGGSEKFQVDPQWRDLILFHEYFHRDNGAGIGASHQTGWTGLVATEWGMIHFPFWLADPADSRHLSIALQ